MKAIKIWSITAMLLIVVSCDHNREVFLKSFVRNYYSADEIELELRSNKVVVIKPSPVVGGGFKPRYLCGYGSYDQTLWNSLCSKHNDLSYNKTVIINRDDYEACYDYIGTDFVSMKVVSDSAFDEQHAAGTDLGDIIRYAYYSPKKYIDSGYKDWFDWKTAGGLAGELYSPRSFVSGSPNQFEHPIEKLVYELTSDDLTLLGVYSLGALQFETKPTLSKAHHLTVTLTTDDGKTLSAGIDLEF